MCRVTSSAHSCLFPHTEQARNLIALLKWENDAPSPDEAVFEQTCLRRGQSPVDDAALAHNPLVAGAGGSATEMTKKMEWEALKERHAVLCAALCRLPGDPEHVMSSCGSLLCVCVYVCVCVVCVCAYCMCVLYVDVCVVMYVCSTCVLYTHVCVVHVCVCICMCVL